MFLHFNYIYIYLCNHVANPCKLVSHDSHYTHIPYISKHWNVHSPGSVVLSGSRPPLQTLVLFLLVPPGQSAVQQVTPSCSPALSLLRSRHGARRPLMVRLWTLVQIKGPGRPWVHVPLYLAGFLFIQLGCLLSAIVKSHFDISRFYWPAVASGRLIVFVSNSLLWFSVQLVWSQTDKERDEVVTQQL